MNNTSVLGQCLCGHRWHTPNPFTGVSVDDRIEVLDQALCSGVDFISLATTAPEHIHPDDVPVVAWLYVSDEAMRHELTHAERGVILEHRYRKPATVLGRPLRVEPIPGVQVVARPHASGAPVAEWLLAPAGSRTFPVRLLSGPDDPDVDVVVGLCRDGQWARAGLVSSLHAVVSGYPRCGMPLARALLAADLAFRAAAA